MSQIMRKRALCLAAVLVAIGCAVGGQQARADIMAIQDWSGNMTSAAYTDVTIGYQFTVGASPISVTKLGLFDFGSNGLGESHDVGIWTTGASPALVASATVTSTSPIEGPTINTSGQFRFEQLTSPVQLSANTAYRIGAYYSSNNTDHNAHSTTTSGAAHTVANEITYNGLYYLNSSGSLKYPTSSAGNRIVGYYGPNFQFVPEPGTWLMLLAAAAVGLLFRRRGNR